MKKLIIMSIMLLLFTACKKEKECQTSSTDYGNHTSFVTSEFVIMWAATYEIPNTSPVESETLAEGLGNACDFEAWKNSYDFSNVPVDTIHLRFIMEGRRQVPRLYIKIR